MKNYNHFLDEIGEEEQAPTFKQFLIQMLMLSVLGIIGYLIIENIWKL